MRRVLKTLSALAAGAVAFGAAASAQVPDQYARQLAGQLSQVETTMSGNGYRRDEGPLSGAAESGGTMDHLVNLRAGRSYTIVGVCDNDCNDVDIRLYDQNNNLIDEDVLVDDMPVVEVTPAFNGPFRVQVLMPGCSTSICYYAFNVYGR
ncbi:MAG: hypothetical protein ACOYKM_03085 [Caulobacterales bacterium]|jgi:hypothetical protein